MSVKRVIDRDFWSHPYIMDNYSVEDKYFFLYLLTNPHTTQLGIYTLSKKYISFETGFTKEIIDVLIDRFENKYKQIAYDTDTQEISILGSLAHSIVKGGKPVEDLLKKELAEVKSEMLIKATYQKMLKHWEKSGRKFDETIKGLFLKEFEKRNLVNEIQNDNDNDNDNENQNENDNSYPHSYNESLDESPTKIDRLSPSVVDEVVKRWNELGLTQVKAIKSGTKRHSSLKARIQEYGIDEIYEAIAQVEASDFLKGKNGRGWKATFDWVVSPNNFPKVVEGNYAQNETNQQTDTMRRLKELHDRYEREGK